MRTAALIFLFLLTIGTSAQRYRVLISEIMADPTPSAGLPEYEWVELYNHSTTVINLAGWRIGDTGSRSGPLPAYELQPGTAVLVAGTTASGHLSTFATCLAVTSWPSLDNTGDLVVLYDNAGDVVHAIRYESNWYTNPVKREGGWTLEMQNPAFACLESDNWRESGSPAGGSPGQPPLPPSSMLLPAVVVQSVYPAGQDILVSWSHAPDATTATDAANYRLLNGPAFLAAELLPPLFNKVRLSLAGPLADNIVYDIIIQNITSCTGAAARSDTLQTGLPQPCEPGDVIINELLFNPLPDGFDYLEIFNRSKKIVDAATLRIASRNSSGQLQSPLTVSPGPDLLLPGGYRVYTTDSSWLKRKYPAAAYRYMRQLSSFPSYPDREGTAVLLNSMNEVTDELSYSEKWHFPLLSTNEGVALERVNADAPSNEPSSWHSASANSGFGTPGYKNSQSLPFPGVLNWPFPGVLNSGEQFNVAQRRLSPNNDGFEDRLVIQYHMPEPGIMAGIRIFDARGRTVRILQRNVLLGNNGQFTWDGLDEQHRPLSPGIYIVWVEWFDLAGKRKIWKEGVVLQ